MRIFGPLCADKQICLPNVVFVSTVTRTSAPGPFIFQVSHVKQRNTRSPGAGEGARERHSTNSTAKFFERKNPAVPPRSKNPAVLRPSKRTPHPSKNPQSVKEPPIRQRTRALLGGAVGGQQRCGKTPCVNALPSLFHINRLLDEPALPQGQTLEDLVRVLPVECKRVPVPPRPGRRTGDVTSTQSQSRRLEF